MKIDNVKNMIGGWFIGNFEPSLLKTSDFEIAVKYYKQGDKEKSHYHKVATEYTVVIYGEVSMNGIHYKQGDIIIEEPGDVTDFCALTDACNVVVKIPSINKDKYVVEG